MIDNTAGAQNTLVFEHVEDTEALIGVIDVGSNSVRLVVFDGATRSPSYFFNEKILCGLGTSLNQTGKLSKKGRLRAFAALERFKAITDNLGVDILDAVATAAVRDATDGAQFCADVKEEIGLNIRIASGADEARLAAQGVLLGEPKASGIVADLGGASMELTAVDNGEIGKGETLPIGPLRMNDILDDDEEVQSFIKDEIKESKLLKQIKGHTLYLVGGAWRALMKAQMNRDSYPLHVLHEYEKKPEDIIEICQWAAELPKDEMKPLAESSSNRVLTIAPAAMILENLVRYGKPSRVVVSAFGMREGVFYEHLPEPLREQDPLLQAVAILEKRRARSPKFGAELYNWLKPVFTDVLPPRLIRAACLLNDIAWRAHPDFRAQASFEAVSRTSLSGVDHWGRVLIGASLMHRHKGGALAAKSEPSMMILSNNDIHLSRALGRAMRLGSMFGGAARGSLSGCKLYVENNELILQLNPKAHVLAGEAVDRRLRTLAETLGKKPIVVLSDV